MFSYGCSFFLVFITDPSTSLGFPFPSASNIHHIYLVGHIDVSCDNGVHRLLEVDVLIEVVVVVTADPSCRCLQQHQRLRMSFQQLTGTEEETDKLYPVLSCIVLTLADEGINANTIQGKQNK